MTVNINLQRLSFEKLEDNDDKRQGNHGKKPVDFVSNRLKRDLIQTVAA